MLSAIEAKEIAKKFQEKETKDLIEMVFKDIETEAMKGKMKTIIYDKVLPNHIVRLLESKDYSVKEIQTGNNENSTEISWELETTRNL